MKTNQIFSLKRFISLIKSDLLINYKKYLMQLGIFVIALFALLYLNMPKSIYQGDFTMIKYMGSFNVGLVALVVYAGLSFSAFSNKKTTRTYLLIPSSTLEKYSTQILGRIIVPALVLIVFFGIDANLSRWVILHTAKTIPSIDIFSYSEALNFIEKYNKMMELMMILLPLSFGMYFFSTRLFFRKNGFIKSALSLSILLFIGVLIFGIFNKIYFPENEFFQMNIPNYKVNEALNNSDVFAIVLLSVSWGFFIIMGFFKLKEKEL